MKNSSFLCFWQNKLISEQVSGILQHIHCPFWHQSCLIGWLECSSFLECISNVGRSCVLCPNTRDRAFVSIGCCRGVLPNKCWGYTHQIRSRRTSAEIGTSSCFLNLSLETNLTEAKVVLISIESAPKVPIFLKILDDLIVGSLSDSQKICISSTNFCILGCDGNNSPWMVSISMPRYIRHCGGGRVRSDF